MKKKLTPKQKLFCKEYLKDLNATQAAIRSGYSKKTAQQIGADNLSKLVIQTEIQKGADKRSKKVEIDADYVLGNIKEIGEHCMKKEDFKETGALKAQELLGKHLLLFPNKHEHSGPGGKPIETVKLDPKLYKQIMKEQEEEDDC